MARKRQMKDTQIKRIRQIAKSNPHVDEQMAAKSIELIVELRRIGVRPKGFNILGISDSKLKVRKAAVFSLNR